MKTRTYLLSLTIICLAGAALLFLPLRKERPSPNSTIPTQPQPKELADFPQPTNASYPAATPRPIPPPRRATPSPSPATGPAENRSAASLAIHPLFESLLDPQTSFQKKQEIWQQITDAGKLDQAIAELEQRAKENPTNADAPAALGRACLQKAGSIQDVREQGILGMKADQVFDAALTQDEHNWEARFWKATAMSYWPSVLGKTNEVMQHFVTLIDQQEATAPRPEYVQTYVRLGEQYQKNGFADYARQIWQRGLGLFPNDPSLKEKLTAMTAHAQN
jgi:tetratricopeptide (TPR) repeat protein